QAACRCCSRWQPAHRGPVTRQDLTGCQVGILSNSRADNWISISQSVSLGTKLPAGMRPSKSAKGWSWKVEDVLVTRAFSEINSRHTVQILQEDLTFVILRRSLPRWRSSEVA